MSSPSLPMSFDVVYPSRQAYPAIAGFNLNVSQKIYPYVVKVEVRERVVFDVKMMQRLVEWICDKFRLRREEVQLAKCAKEVYVLVSESRHAFLIHSAPEHLQLGCHRAAIPLIRTSIPYVPPPQNLIVSSFLINLDKQANGNKLQVIELLARCGIVHSIDLKCCPKSQRINNKKIKDAKALTKVAVRYWSEDGLKAWNTLRFKLLRIKTFVDIKNKIPARERDIYSWREIKIRLKKVKAGMEEEDEDEAGDEDLKQDYYLSDDIADVTSMAGDVGDVYSEDEEVVFATPAHAEKLDKLKEDLRQLNMRAFPSPHPPTTDATPPTTDATPPHPCANAGHLAQVGDQSQGHRGSIPFSTAPTDHVPVSPAFTTSSQSLAKSKSKSKSKGKGPAGAESTPASSPVKNDTQDATDAPPTSPLGPNAFKRLRRLAEKPEATVKDIARYKEEVLRKDLKMKADEQRRQENEARRRTEREDKIFLEGVDEEELKELMSIQQIHAKMTQNCHKLESVVIGGGQEATEKMSRSTKATLMQVFLESELAERIAQTSLNPFSGKGKGFEEGYQDEGERLVPDSEDDNDLHLLLAGQLPSRFDPQGGEIMISPYDIPQIQAAPSVLGSGSSIVAGTSAGHGKTGEETTLQTDQLLQLPRLQPTAWIKHGSSRLPDFLGRLIKGEDYEIDDVKQIFRMPGKRRESLPPLIEEEEEEDMAADVIGSKRAGSKRGL